MRFHVKCVRCGRIAEVKSSEPVSSNAAIEEPVEPDSHLDGYIIQCPACGELRQSRNPPVLARSAVAAILTEALPVSA